MGMRQLETKILQELRIVASNKKLRQKDIIEWSSGGIEAHDGEEIYHLPELNVNVAIKVTHSQDITCSSHAERSEDFVERFARTLQEEYYVPMLYLRPDGHGTLSCVR